MRMLVAADWAVSDAEGDATLVALAAQAVLDVMADLR